MYNKSMDPFNRIHSKWRWSHFLNKILIVDPSEIDSIEMSYILNRHGYEHITICSSGEEAIAIAQESNPDLILCNVNLPDMDGFELSRRVNLMEHVHSKVVMVADEVRSVNLAKSRESGAVDFLIKTRDFDYLSRTVHDLIES